MRLSDLFPQKDKESFAKTNLAPNSVLKAISNFKGGSKEKRFIVLSIIQDEVCVVHINTKINVNVNRTPLLHALQMPIKKCNHEQILEHDSFIDCSDIYIYSYTGLLNNIISDAGTYLGNIDNNIRIDIINKLESSPKISNKQRAKYLIV